jgi:exosome complex RNA-binding protein Rrp42 (RNase PH superfamily)
MTENLLNETTAQLLSRASEQIQTANRAVNQVLHLVGVIPSFEPVFEDAGNAVATDQDGIESLAMVARKRIKQRRLRDSVLGMRDLFGEPAWEILLDLFVAKADGSRVSVSSACAASTAPHTTALRYLKALEENGMIKRSAHETDARIIYVTLSDTALGSMMSILSQR